MNTIVSVMFSLKYMQDTNFELKFISEDSHGPVQWQYLGNIIYIYAFCLSTIIAQIKKIQFVLLVC